MRRPPAPRRRRAVRRIRRVGAEYPQCMLRVTRFRGTERTDEFLDGSSGFRVGETTEGVTRAAAGLTFQECAVSHAARADGDGGLGTAI